MKSRSKVLVYSFYLLALMAGYLLLGLGSLLVPDKAVERHVRQTVEKSDLQTDLSFAFLYKSNYWTDNFTDALITNQAVMLTADTLGLNAWERLMLVPRVDGGMEQCKVLHEMVEGTAERGVVYYPRYWHGSTFLMRYLLALDDYVGLRSLFYLLSSLLLLWLLLALARRVGVWASALYLVAFVLVDGFMMQFSIQYLSVLLIALAGSLGMVTGTKTITKTKIGLGFFVLGSVTAYFDLLTAPLLTWGLPLLVLVARHTPRSLRDSSRTLLSSLLWGVGYAGTWAAKWLMATLTTPMNVFRDASAQATVRATVEEYSRWDAVGRNLGQVPWLLVAIAVAVLVLLAVRHFRREGWRQALVCLAIAVAPVMWYLLLGNHSYEHFWFTYRSLAVTVLGLLMAVGSLVEWRELRVES